MKCEKCGVELGQVVLFSVLAGCKLIHVQAKLLVGQAKQTQIFGRPNSWLASVYLLHEIDLNADRDGHE